MSKRTKSEPVVIEAREPVPLSELHRLERGIQHIEVLDVRALLIARSYDIAYTMDFDAELEAAVRQFQGDIGLKVDGVVGLGTWKALMKLPKPAPDPEPEPEPEPELEPEPDEA